MCTVRIWVVDGAFFFRNKRLLVTLVCYAVYAGPPLAWVTILDFSLKPLGFHQVGIGIGLGRQVLAIMREA